VAVVGAGRLGGFHAQKLARHDAVELVAVADPVAAARERIATECGTQSVADYRQLVGRIDAAVIAAPTPLHHSIARDLLDRGVHLLVEKPLTVSAAEADDLVRIARRKGLVLQVGHVERFNPALTAAAELLREPRYLEAVRSGTFTFRSMDVGVVLDLMIHDIDLVLSLVRSPVCRIDAVGTPVLTSHEDTATARIEFANGCVASLSACRVGHEAVRRMHVWSAGGFAGIDFAARKATLVRPSEEVRSGRFDAERLTPAELAQKERLLQTHLPREDVEIPAVDALALEVADFVESVQTGRSPRVTGQDGRDAVAVAERIVAQIAARSTGTPHPAGALEHAVIPAPHFRRSA
jgi:predicted dehydrogenase